MDGLVSCPVSSSSFIKFEGSRKKERGRGGEMLQFPSFMTQYPATTVIPSSLILPSQWPSPHNDEVALAMAEAEFEVKISEIKKANSNLIVIGKTTVDNDKEDFDNEADDDEGDNAEESEGDDFEQETG